MVVAYAATWIFASSMDMPREGSLDIWHRWDAVHYLAISEHGYRGPGTVGYVTASMAMLASSLSSTCTYWSFPTA